MDSCVEMLLLAAGAVFVVALFPYCSGLTAELSESDYSGSAANGYINAEITLTDKPLCNVTLRVTPITYSDYNGKYSVPLRVPTGCYEARSDQFNSTPIPIVITRNTLTGAINFAVGIIQRNQSERPKSCFIIVLDVMSGGCETVRIKRNISSLYIYNSYPFTVSFEIPEATVDEDVGSVEIYVVKDNNQKVAYNFTLQLLDTTPFQTGIGYTIEQLAVPFPAQMQRTSVFITIANFSVSKEDQVVQLTIQQTQDYTVSKENFQLTITNNNYVTIQLEKATFWLTVCLSVVDPSLERTIILNIKAAEEEAIDPFFSSSIFLDNSKTRDCIDVTDSGNLSSFLVTVSSQSIRVRIFPDRDTRENEVVVPASSQVFLTSSEYDSASFEERATLLQYTVTGTLQMSPTASVWYGISHISPSTTNTITTALENTESMSSYVATSTLVNYTYVTPVISFKEFSTLLTSETDSAAFTQFQSKSTMIATFARSQAQGTSYYEDTVTSRGSVLASSSELFTTTLKIAESSAAIAATYSVTNVASKYDSVSFEEMATLFQHTVTATLQMSSTVSDSISHTTNTIITPLENNESTSSYVATSTLVNYTYVAPLMSSKEFSTLLTSETDSVAFTQFQSKSTMIATSARSQAQGTSYYEDTVTSRGSVLASSSELFTTTLKIAESSAAIAATYSMTSATSNLLGTSEPALTATPVVTKNLSWLIVLVITVACGLLCCLCCAVAACLYVCLFYRRAQGKAYFPASIEGHDERYNKWRCGVYDEVLLEEYKVTNSQ